jgi:stage II sporulation protein D
MDVSPLKLTRLSLLLCVILSMFTPIGTVLAQAPLVRVLLAQDQQRVDVASQTDSLLINVNGQEQAVRSPLAIAATPGGFLLNGIKVPGEQALIRASEPSLSVTTETKGANGLSRSNGNGGASSGGSKATLEVSGLVQLVRRGTGVLVVNHVDLEEYVKGVVPHEINAAWHPEVLKAQAVAARTYALYHKLLSVGRDFDVVATVQDQVYRGRQGIDRAVEEAVEATRGLVVTYQEAPIYAAFSSTAAGPTEDAITVWAKDLPYLKGVECPFDLNSPFYQWKASFKLEGLERTLRQQGHDLGTIITISPVVLSRAGRVAKLRVLHSKGELILRGEDLRKAVGYSVIPSTQFTIESIGADAVLSGYGAGHAVGLCQWGAKELAELGYSFSTILQYYYPGTDLTTVSLTKPPSFPSPVS